MRATFSEPGVNAQNESGCQLKPITSVKEWIQHPFFILRLAGLPVEAVELLSGGLAIKHWEQLQRLTMECNKRATHVADTLKAVYPALAQVLTHGDAQKVLQLKRDIYNLRLADPSAVSSVLPYLAPLERHELEAVNTAISELNELKLEWPNIYGQALESGRAGLRQLFRSENLHAALQVTNPPFYHRIQGFLESAGRRGKQKEAEANWNSLLNYVLRASQKVSPLSSMGLFTCGEWHPDGVTKLAQVLAFQDKPLDSAIHLRHAPFQALLLSCFKQWEHLSGSAPVQLNPTLTSTGGDLHWIKITANEPLADRIHRATHAAVSVRSSKASELLIAAFHRLKKERPTAAELVEELLALLPSQLAPSIPRVLDEALGHGLLQFAGEPDAQLDLEEWVGAIRVHLANGPRGQSIHDALNALGRALQDLRSAPRQGRAAEVDLVEAWFEALAAAIGQPRQAADVRPLVHEDCALDTPPIRVRQEAIGDIRDDLVRVLRAVSFLSNSRTYGASSRFIAQRFVERFGVNGRCAEPEQFLGEVAQVFGTPSNAGDDPEEKVIRDVADAFFSQALAPLVTGRPLQLDIAPDVLASHVALLPAPLRARRASHCINGQFCPVVRGQPRLVINQIYPGNSRMLSRFLPKDTVSRNKVVSYLRSIARSGRYAAIPGLFGFSANRHPNLADSEITIPPFENDWRDTQKMALADCELRFDPVMEQLYLVAPDGAPIDTYFLGIQVPQRLPHLHRMLDALGNGSDGVRPIWRNIAERTLGYGHQLVHVPRVTMGSLILARRTLCVPREMLPDNNCSDRAFFEHIQHWRHELELPQEVYFHQEDQRFTDWRSIASGSVLEKSTFLAIRKLAKPTYLDFANPLMVSLLRRSLARSLDLVLSEALPAPADAIAQIDGRAHVCEFSFELTILPEAATCK